MPLPDFSEIIKAQVRLRNTAKLTPLERSSSFSLMTGANVYLKLENLQKTGSFKVRGAYNKICSLTEEERAKGVVCASAGNHAQGIAYSATALGVQSTICMPLFTPPLKVIATRAYGGNVILQGNGYDDAYEIASKHAKENGAVYIHAFDDPQIIAGQGTIGLEIFDQLKDVDTVIVPIGGGGLISGVGIAMKSVNPKIQIIGVEADTAQSMYESLHQGKLVGMTSLHTIADGIAVKKPGPLTFEAAQKFVDEVVVVNDMEMAHALYLLLQRGKVLAEPSGIASLAALINGKVDCKGKNVVCLISGGNINMGVLQQIIEQGMKAEGLRVTVELLIPDQAGELKKVLSILEESRVNIHDIVHERSNKDVPVGYVQVTITFNTQDTNQIDSICSCFSANSIKYRILQ